MVLDGGRVSLEKRMAHKCARYDIINNRVKYGDISAGNAANAICPVWLLSTCIRAVKKSDVPRVQKAAHQLFSANARCESPEDKREHRRVINSGS